MFSTLVNNLLYFLRLSSCFPIISCYVPQRNICWVTPLPLTGLQQPSCLFPHEEPELTSCQDGGGPLCPADTVGASEEGHSSASEPAGGGEPEQSQRSQPSTGIEYAALCCCLFYLLFLLGSKLIIRFFSPSFIEIYAKIKSNGLIQAEPPELHVSGFELGKDYVKILVRNFVFFVFAICSPVPFRRGLNK